MNEDLIDRLLPLPNEINKINVLNYINVSRNLPLSAMVTRFAPSPTGFMHIGGIYVSLINKIMARQSGGVFFLRIEDTDSIRSNKELIEVISSILKKFGLAPDEGVINVFEDKCEQLGNYGPYIQTERKNIYHVFVRELLRHGYAYPCFMSQDQLEEIRLKQTKLRKRPGCYAEWAVWRNAAEKQVHNMLDKGAKFVIRFKSKGCYDNPEVWYDEIKGKIVMPQNDHDIVLLKSDGLPTYHFAHVVDDRLMETTHVIRGDEWLSSVPIHLELFRAFDWNPPIYAHIAPIEKNENINGYISRRKLSKRKDTEADITYYLQQGFPVEAIIKYLLNLMDSSFLAWQEKYPEKSFNEFGFTMKKLSKHGALHDLDKLKSISQDVISLMDHEALYQEVLTWANDWDVELFHLMKKHQEYTKKILSMERGGGRPSKRFTTWKDVRPQIFFMYDELYCQKKKIIIPEKISKQEMPVIIRDFLKYYRQGIDNNEWLALLKNIAKKYNYAESVKEYKSTPDRYKGHFGDIAMLLRMGVCSVPNSPDLREVCNLLGYDRVQARLNKLLKCNH